MRIWIALLLVVVASVLFWASRDHAIRAPDWSGRLNGLSYSPSGLYSESDLDAVSPERIRADLKQLSQVTRHIRTYTVARGLSQVPEIAAQYGLKVALEIWIGGDKEANDKEIASAIAVALKNRRVVDRVFVGNEAIERGDVTVAELNSYIARVRGMLPNSIQISTAEPWDIWLRYPALGKTVDFIGVHILPYWEGISVGHALSALKKRYALIQQRFPHKPIVIAETGWPSEGRTKRAAQASVSDQAYFIRGFTALAAKQGYDYYLIEAFDQPWKGMSEGAVGAYWGLCDAGGKLKFKFTGALHSFPKWRSYAGAAALLTLVIGLIVLGGMPRVRGTGYALMGGLIAALTSGILIVVDASALEYIQASDIVFYFAMIPLVLLSCTVILTEGAEVALSLWREERRLLPTRIPERAPLVSIHVPCCNEPPEMVIGTLNALARLDYANFEVIVLDNNTRDANLWRPVQAHCARIGPRFRFFHFDGMKGFKSGALNEALRLTDPAADFIAVIDSDYQVSSHWLAKAMPYFANANIAVVQAPQDYRDCTDNLFKKMCYQEYRGFFHVGMVERNEHDAIIQHGTMTIVRKRALLETGGWSEWCITEDAELGLRLFEKGYSAVYLRESLGRGVMPDTLAAYVGQRYRWVYGAMQILKHHAKAMLFGGTELTIAQRYQFIAGWLPWISDGLGLVVTLFALVWTGLMTMAPAQFDVPMEALSTAALGLFAIKTAKTFMLYPSKVGSGVMGALRACIAGLALTHTVGKAVLAGLFTSNFPFLRTPKCEQTAPLWQILRIAWQEIALFFLCSAAVIVTAMSRRSGDSAASLWMAMLAVQALPFGATIIAAILSAVANAGRLSGAPDLRSLPPTEQSATA